MGGGGGVVMIVGIPASRRRFTSCVVYILPVSLWRRLIEADDSLEVLESSVPEVLLGGPVFESNFFQGVFVFLVHIVLGLIRIACG